MAVDKYGYIAAGTIGSNGGGYFMSKEVKYIILSSVINQKLTSVGGNAYTQNQSWLYENTLFVLDAVQR